MSELEGKWWAPHALFEAAHAIRRSMPQSEFLRRPDMRGVREAITCSSLAVLRPWNRDWEVFTVPQRDQFPDAVFRCGNDVRRFEVTWVDHPGRRMSEEYVQAEAREAAGLPPILEHYDWQEESDLGLRLIVERIDQKAQKRYRPKPNLLLHVNLDRSEHAASSLYAWQIGQMFGDSFDSIWLLWGSRAVRLWPNPARIKAIASPA
jgi:hypothetical protein